MHRALLLLACLTAMSASQETTPQVKVYQIDAVREARRDSGRAYREFLDVPAMSLGLYELPAGGRDPQQPHDRDEAYYVLAGRAVLVGAGERRPVKAGSVIYVRRGAEHRFEAITEDLSLLVVFAAEPRKE